MDPVENHARNFLLSQFREIVFEPLGHSRPPDFLGDGEVAIEVRRLNQNFTLLLADADEPLGEESESGGHWDCDSGGWVQSELIRNIQLCVDEKARKMKPIEGLYNRWWLVLVDHVSLGIGPSFSDVSFIKQNVVIPPLWEKVVLLSPGDHRHWNEL